MARRPRSVFSVLSDSPRARAVKSIALGFGRSATIWRNERDRVAYRRPEGHTFSLYLAGGDGTRRVDGAPASGWPGAVCVMPQGRDSEWEITTPFAFVHVYIPAAEMGRAFAEAGGGDARSFDLREITLEPAPLLAGALRRVARATAAGDHLSADEAVSDLLAVAFADPRCGGGGVPLRGGLAPHLGRRVQDYVEAHLDEAIRLDDLARLTRLSAFHLQRMFRASHGVSPQVWITHRRVARAMALLRGAAPIAEIALSCGFSSQSHLTRTFKASTGVTPGAYRQRL